MKTRLLLALAYAKDRARLEYCFGKHSDYAILFIRFFFEGLYQSYQPFVA